MRFSRSVTIAAMLVAVPAAADGPPRVARERAGGAETHSYDTISGAGLGASLTLFAPNLDCNRRPWPRWQHAPFNSGDANTSLGPLVCP